VAGGEPHPNRKEDPMASYFVSQRGNTALQAEIWRLSVADALVVSRILDRTPGSYWHTTLLRPAHRARRGNQPEVLITTAGFSTGELANALAACEIPYTERPSY
jgi:hypothetical protein